MTLRNFIVANFLMIGALAGAPAGVCQPVRLVRCQYTEVHMGVPTRLTLYAPDETAAAAAARTAFDRMAYLDSLMSDYRPDSELMRLCRSAPHESSVRVSSELFAVLECAEHVSRISGGAFDPTVGPLVKLWRKARLEARLPGASDVAAARALTGRELMRIDRTSKTVRLTKSGMLLDLGGIAKGYACDEAARVLRSKGVRSFLIEMGGDIYAGSPPPGDTGWRVDLPKPLASNGKTLRIANSAVSTSGDTEQFVEIGGVRYSHVVDPGTGVGLTSRYVAVVTGPRAMLTDAVSTASTVIGSDAPRALSPIKGYRILISSYGRSGP